jgi:hypothetical protein
MASKYAPLVPVLHELIVRPDSPSAPMSNSASPPSSTTP